MPPEALGRDDNAFSRTASGNPSHNTRASDAATHASDGSAQSPGDRSASRSRTAPAGDGVG
jgi:hypothetical protein